MANIAKSWGNNLRNGRTIIWVYLAFAAGWVISIILVASDFSTNLTGWDKLPIEPPNIGAVRWAIAALPQVGPIVFGSMFMLNTKKRWSFFVALAFLGVDNYTDTSHYSAGFTHDVGISWAVSFIFFTIGSDILFTTCGTMLLELFPDFTKQIASFIGVSGEGLNDVFDSLGVFNNENDEQNNQKNNSNKSQNSQRNRNNQGGRSNFSNLPPNFTPTNPDLMFPNREQKGQKSERRR